MLGRKAALRAATDATRQIAQTVPHVLVEGDADLVQNLVDQVVRLCLLLLALCANMSSGVGAVA